jgi:hypothetical protein
VQAVLASHIDRLPTEEKELLQTLAVLGREFPLGLVQRVTLKPADEMERGLERLQAGEFIYEQLAAGDVEYTFKHALTQRLCEGYFTSRPGFKVGPKWRFHRRELTNGVWLKHCANRFEFHHLNSSVHKAHESYKRKGLSLDDPAPFS